MSDRERAPDGRRILNVSGLLEAGRSVLESEIGPVWVEAEVFEYRGPHRGSGHRYFKLRDDNASMSAILWRGVADSALSSELRDGQKVLVRGSFDIYAARGTLSFVLDRVEDRGAGNLAQRFEEMKRKLQMEGLFDPERKRVIPERVRQVVLITGADSAAEADVLHVFRSQPNPVRVLVRHARVQGEGAVPDLLAALKEAVSISPDLIMLSRGGGSMEDLWAFNEEALVRAVAACEIPVISAVGHEVDFSLCDFVADERAITPTAGAQRIVAPWVEGMDQMQVLGRRLTRCAVQFTSDAKSALRNQADLVGAMQRFLRDKKTSFERGMQSFTAQHPAQRLERQGLRLRHAEQRLMAGVEGRLHMGRVRLQRQAGELASASPKTAMELHKAGLSKASARLEAGNPEGLLNRGYALVKAEGHDGFLRDPRAAPQGTAIRIQLAKGDLRARVE